MAQFVATFKNGTKQTYDLQGDPVQVRKQADLDAFKPAEGVYLVTALGANGKVDATMLVQYSGDRGGIQPINPDNGSIDPKVIALADYKAALLGDKPGYFEAGRILSFQLVTPAKAVDPVVALIAEADACAAQLITAKALTQEQYDKDKAEKKGAGWSEATATEFRNKYKIKLDAFKAYQTSSKPSTPTALYVGGALLLAFLLFRK